MVESIEIFGKYTLLERVAVGGMAEIYRAKTVGLGGFEKILAIKRLHPEFGREKDVAQMLVDEARIAVHLAHPNIAQIFDLGCIDGQYFIAMEFIEGADLHQISKILRARGETIAQPALLFIMAEALGGLHYAHTRSDPQGKPLQIVHRDVSPQNIMISHEGEVKLVDFGIAKAELSSEDTHHGIIKGKFYYMSPEQAYGHHIDARTDIFAAGMVLYELLAGQNPYHGVDEARLLKAVRQADFTPIFASGVPVAPELAEIITRATRRDPEQRYASAADMQAALMGYLNRLGQPYRRMELATYMGELLGSTQHSIESSQAMSRVDYEANEASMIFTPGATLLDELAELERQDADNPFREEEPTRLWGTEGPKPPGHIRDLVARSGPPGPSVPAAAPGFSTSADGFAPPGMAAAPAAASANQRAVAAVTAAMAAVDGEARHTTSQTTQPLYERLIPVQYRTPQYVLGAASLALLLVAGSVFWLASGKSQGAEGAPVAGSALAEPTVEPGPAMVVPDAARVSVRIVAEPPGAQVSLDGEVMGNAPLTLQGLSVRQAYDVVVSLDGYEELTRTIQPTAETDVLEFTLRARGGVLKISTYPSNAEVHVDGKAYGRSPLDVPGMAQDSVHEVRAVLDDGREVTKSVSWDGLSDRVMKVSLDFEPIAQPAKPKPQPAARRARKPARSKAIDLFGDKKSKKSGNSKPAVLNIWD